MPRRDRHTPDEPNVVFEVMTRCFQSRNYLAASRDREVGEIYLGVWARALLMDPGVRLADLVTLPNLRHALLVVADNDPELLAGFMCYLNGHLATELTRAPRACRA